MDKVEKFFDGVNFDKVRTVHPPQLIFLCGGKDTEEKKYFRTKILEKLKKDYEDCTVFQADDIMNVEVSKKLGKDLLELEKYIAALVSVIPIVCESHGSIAELGAFVSDEIIRKKICIIVEDKFYEGPQSESFIRWGPIENYEKNNKCETHLFSEEKHDEEQDKEVDAICTAVLKCKPATSKFDFYNKYFHILLLIDIMNVLPLPTIKEIKKALNYALKLANPKPVDNTNEIKEISLKEIEEMIFVLKALKLIQEKGKEEKYFMTIRKEFYLRYRQDELKKDKNIYEIREESIDDIYSR